MQLTIFRFIVIISLLPSIIGTKYEEEYTEKLAAIDHPMNKMNFSQSSAMKSPPKKLDSRANRNCQRRRKLRHIPSGLRGSRTTYVKAILSNPKLSAGQQLAQKLAWEELHSPKMKEIFKKLTAVHSPKKSPRRSSGFVGIGLPSSQNERRRRKRKKTRHKRRRKNRTRSINLNGRKATNSRVRSPRQISKFQQTNNSNRYGKSINPNDYSNVLLKKQNPGDVPNLNLRPKDSEIENSDLSYQNPGIGDHSYDSLPLSEQNDNFVNPYSLDNDQSDHLAEEDNMRRLNLPTSSADNFYSNNQNNFYDPEKSQNPFMSNQSFGNSNMYVPNGAKNVQTTSYNKNYENQKYLDEINAKNDRFRNYGSLNRDLQKDLSLYPNHGTGSINKIPVSRFVDRNKDSANPMNISKFISTENESKTKFSMAKNMKNLKQRKISTSKINKNYQTTENCLTSTEINSKTEGTEAFAVLQEMTEKSFQKSKSLKEKELQLSTNGQSLHNQQKNDTGLANETKKVAGQILNKIIEELEDLKMDRTRTDNKEGLPCKLSGSWVTTQAGVRIDMLALNKTINVSMAKHTLPVGIAHQGFLNSTWNITGHAPFQRGGPFSLIATDNHTKSLAVFVGACRVCGGIDTIEGVWSIAREPRDCRGFQVATSIYNDIFRRTKLLSAIKEKQKAIALSMTKKTSTFTSSTKGDYSTSTCSDEKIV